MAGEATRTRLRLERRGDIWQGEFDAMAGPCAILAGGVSRAGAERALALAAEEAWRVETKFTRYRDSGIVHAINRSLGRPVVVDEETARLLEFADDCHRLSEGRFDITSGVLRRAWTFDGSDHLPDPALVKSLLRHVGWHKVTWTPPVLSLPAGMEIDLGGIGKEYAVDRVSAMLGGIGSGSFLVNFGGDIRVTGPQPGGRPWSVGLEHPGRPEIPIRAMEIRHGAIATSGDSRRFLIKDGVRYGHILDPRTGWPAGDSPRSATVQADTCVEAGMLATVAVLRGRDAESFLDAQGVRGWCVR